jgi:hypothetical protein
VFNLTAIKSAFFDSARVKKELDSGTRKALSRIGAFVRRRAKSSIRKRKAISEPGRPPSSHAGHLRNLIYFAYDPKAKSVVVGPVPFKGKPATTGLVPGILERGGTTTRKLSSGQGRTLRYRARPYMAPALEAERPHFTDAFKGAFSRR